MWPELSTMNCVLFGLWSFLLSVNREKEESCLVYIWFFMICRYHQKVNTIACQAFSRKALKESDEESPPSGKNLEQCPWLFNLLERRNDQVCNYILIHGLWPMVWLDDQIFGGNIMGKLGTKTFRQTSLNEQKNLKLFMSQENAHQRVTLAEEHFNNQMDSVTCFVNISLLPQLPLSLPSEPMNKKAIVAGMKVMRGFSNMDFTNQGCPGYSHAEWPIFHQQRSTLSPLHGTVPWDDHPATWWHVDYIKLLLFWKAQCFVLTEIDTCSVYRFAFPACDASAKSTYMHSRDASSSIKYSHTAFFFCSRKSFLSKSKAMGHTHETHRFYYASPPAWRSWFDRMVKWPGQDSVTPSPARWQYLAGLKKSSPKALHVLNQHFMYVLLFPQPDSQV